MSSLSVWSPMHECCVPAVCKPNQECGVVTRHERSLYPYMTACIPRPRSGLMWTTHTQKSVQGSITSWNITKWLKITAKKHVFGHTISSIKSSGDFCCSIDRPHINTKFSHVSIFIYWTQIPRNIRMGIGVIPRESENCIRYGMCAVFAVRWRPRPWYAVVVLTINSPFCPASSVHPILERCWFCVHILWDRRRQKLKLNRKFKCQQVKCQPTGYENTTTQARPEK